MGLERLLGLLLILSTMSSCDPARLLTIQNRTGKDLTFKMIKNPNSKYFVQNPDIVSHTLRAKGDSSEIVYLFALGVWSKQDLSELQSSINQIQVISNSDTTIYKTKEELLLILPQKRRGLVNNYLKIKIE